MDDTEQGTSGYKDRDKQNTSQDDQEPDNEDRRLRIKNLGLEGRDKTSYSVEVAQTHLQKILSGDSLNICRDLPITYAKDGDIYFHVFNFNDKEKMNPSRFDIFLNDAYVLTRIQNQNKASRHYYYCKAELKKQLDAENVVRPTKIVDFHSETLNSNRTAVSVLYLGALDRAGKDPHGNCKDKKNAPAHKRGSKAVMAELRSGYSAGGMAVKPTEAKRRIQEKIAVDTGLSDRAREILAPTLNQAAYTKKQEKSKSYISPDPLFSVYQLCHIEENPIIWQYEMWPCFLVIFGSKKGIDLVNSLFRILRSRDDARFQLGYDTTFNVGRFYLSTLVARNFLVQGSPVFPIIHMIHDRRLTETHTFLWEWFMRKCHKDFIPVIHSVPITVDREYAIGKAIRFFCREQAQITYCKLHLVDNFKQMLKRKKGFSSQREKALALYRDLCECTSEEDYETKFEQIQKGEVWTSDIVKKFLDPVRGFDHLTRTKSAAFAVMRFRVFDDKAATNNISESYNARVRKLHISVNTRVDYAILQLIENEEYLIDQQVGGMRKSRTGDGKKLDSIFADESAQVLKNLGWSSTGSKPTSVESIVAKVKEAWNKRVLEKTQATGMEELVSKEASLMEAVQLETKLVSLKSGKEYTVSVVSGSPEPIMALVSRPLKSPLNYLVQMINGKLTCSCNMSRNCGHVYAAKLKLGNDIVTGKPDTLEPARLQIAHLKRIGLSGAKAAEPKEQRYPLRHRANLPDYLDKSSDIEEGRFSGLESSQSEETSIFRNTIDISADLNISSTSEAEREDSTLPEIEDVSSHITPFENNYIDDIKFSRKETAKPESKSCSRTIFHSTPIVRSTQKRGLESDFTLTLQPTICESIQQVAAQTSFKRQDESVISSINKKYKFDYLDVWHSWETSFPSRLTNLKIDDATLSSLEPKKFVSQTVLDLYTQRIFQESEKNTPNVNESVSRHLMHIPSDVISYLNAHREPLSHKSCMNYLLRHFKAYTPANKSLVSFHFNTSGSHWITGLICMTSRRVILFDSLRSAAKDRRLAYEFSSRYVQLAHLFGGHQEDLSLWRYQLCSNSPQQENMFDCGIFCINICHMLLAQSRTIGQPPLSGIARSIIYNALHGTYTEFEKELETWVKSISEKYDENRSVQCLDGDDMELFLSRILTVDYNETSTTVDFSTLWEAECHGVLLCLRKSCKYVSDLNETHSEHFILRCVGCKRRYHCNCYEKSKLNAEIEASCCMYFYCHCKLGSQTYAYLL
ncbi:hypothetical protein HDE_12494 [Halotydeus destructor]|nr:hypothetical protein HDE_12494 [Halotydeus destructor]